MRGGTASCTVIVADEPIGSPIVDRFDAAVVLTALAFARFAPRVARGGIIVVNESLIEAPIDRDDIRVVPVDCTSEARAAGGERLTAVVGLGALAVSLTDDECQPLLPLERVRASLRTLVEHKHPELLEGNLAAFEAGARAPVGSLSGSL